MEARAALDYFLPVPDVRDRHETRVRAPAHIVMDVARHFDLQSIGLVRAIFWLRAVFMGSKTTAAGPALGLDQLQLLGWGTLDDRAGRHFIAGATCQPWLADVLFTPHPPQQFAEYSEPDHVKIVWTVEVEPTGPEEARFATETRAGATDAQARAKFLRYWQLARYGIVMIRLLLVPAIRRQAERRWRAMTGH